MSSPTTEAPPKAEENVAQPEESPAPVADTKPPTDVTPTTEEKKDEAEATPVEEETNAEAEEKDGASASPSSPKTKNAEPKEKRKPYINPERFKTGGTPRDKLSDEELVERMNKIREQNERIKQRRLDVQADEEAFKKTQESDRVRQAQRKAEQEKVNQTREQNARRKMDKIGSREWDSAKRKPKN